MDTETKSEGRAVAWNKGKLLGQKPPLKLRAIWAIRIPLQLDHRTRELALFNLAIGIATAQLKPDQFVFPSRVSSHRICRLDSILESLHRGSPRSDLIRWLMARIRCVGRKPR